MENEEIINGSFVDSSSFKSSLAQAAESDSSGSKTQMGLLITHITWKSPFATMSQFPGI